ncbi:PREDICTED: uncharacterized protein LOC109158301 isoform X2 [Ipomoea nil]|uniref:uncharacterized protein LOC109158301 isoform X2 n=1 Tax=Ipomoea nil TaxID=35883 RepID=UPI000900D5DA|nr:PREDICTED: uncharacterized protein LOC109158301 isoform X2 [Ipomoea nil]
MATAAFKSTSKRGTVTNATNPNSRENPTPASSSSSSSKPLRRRSLSVSAISRTTTQDTSSEFSNKRDNPLFWTSNSPPGDHVGNEKEIGNENETGKSALDGFSIGKVASGSTKSRTPNSAAENRGRSTTRSSGGVRDGIGRSVSRVRGRSVSRGHYGSAYESEKEQELILLKNSKQSRELKQVANSFKGSTLIEKNTDTCGRVNRSKIATVRGQGIECSEDDSTYSQQISTWEDGISIGSLSEAEDKIIKASEQLKSFRDGHWVNDTAASGIYETVRAEVRRAISDIQSDLQSVIQRNNVNTISSNGAANIPPNSNPASVELVLNIRREYSRKLEESEERTRQLQADLAIEEHRGQELNRILKEIVPDPKKNCPQRSRIGRRKSNERKKMTQRLTEDAMAYFDHFDECVSISTFDSSDLSAPEDPPHSSIGATSVSRSLFEPQGSIDSFSGNKKILGGIDLMGDNEGSGLTAAASNSKEPALLHPNEKGNGSVQGEQVQFSFTQKSPKPARDDDIRSCIKRFERDAYKDAIDSEIIVSHYDASEYKLQSQIESLWFDRMLYNSRIESGGLHLCGGGIAVVSFPFGSSF